LISAIVGKKIKLIQILLDAGADVNERPTYSPSPLAAAAAFIKDDNAECIKLLISRGADINSNA
jgi:ankyrin repeat protein